MSKITHIRCRKVLNSRVEFTNEFIIKLENGTVGVGSSPRGETISIYENKPSNLDAEEVIQKIKKDGCLSSPISQKKLDEYLEQNVNVFGNNNCYAISLAFYNAKNRIQSSNRNIKRMRMGLSFPKLCLNILNGGWHAYTNPVLSEFHEYILVPRNNNIFEIIDDHNKIQMKVREKLLGAEKVIVSKNPVNKFKKLSNDSCIEVLLDVLQELNLSTKYDLMIDASAGDFLEDGKYRFSLTDNSIRTGAELCEYWIDLIERFNIKFLEDPFAETDFESWQMLTKSQNKCFVIGNNFYASRADKIREGADEKYTSGVIIMPDQAITVSGAVKAIKTAQSKKQVVITSHRSISTESTFVAHISCVHGVQYIKIGPLFTDYSAILRLNEIIRLTWEG